MATQTKARRPSSNRQGQARFTRSASQQGQSRFARGTAAPARRPSLRPKRRPQQSGPKKLVGGILPTGGAKKGGLSKKSSNKGKIGGLGAMLAAGAGLAYKNRDKLNQMRHRYRDTTSVRVEPYVPPVITDS